MSNTTYSEYQLSILEEVKAKAGNCAVNAVAGSGKTYICVESLQFIPKIYSVQFNAFGKDIADALRKKNLPSNCRVSTYNAFGWGICLRQLPRKPNLDPEKTVQVLQHMVLGAKEEDSESWKKFQSCKSPIKRLISLLKGRLIFDVKDAEALIPELIDHHSMEVPNYPDFMQVLLDTFAKSIEVTHTFDFDDQIYQVLKLGLIVPCFDYVFVDEFQDSNEMQFKLMQEACRGGRFFGVGDPDQSIYGFRGATPDAFRRFVREFKAKELPLSICYRCPKLVVAEARKIVPRIEPAPWKKDGTVDTISTDQFKRLVQPGDFVLCRTAAPCVKRCLENIRAGVPACVLGREIGEDLEYLIDKVSQQSYFMNITTFRDLLGEYVQKKLKAYQAFGMENLSLALSDKHETLMCLMLECQTVSDIFKQIRRVFDDDKGKIRICYLTIHKSKGLENENVFILRPDLLPHPKAKGQAWMMEEEQRLEYVAKTRAKNAMYYVTKERDEK